MIRFRPLLVMSLFSIAALAALVSLGRWQWHRYECKHAAGAEPVPEITIVDYQPVPDGLQFVHGVRADTREQGWRVFAPVQDGATFIFVDADFVLGVDPPATQEVRFPASLRTGAPITGASIRPSAPGACGRSASPLGAWLSLPPQPLRRLWFTADLEAMGRNAGLESVADYYVAAAYIGADGRAAPNPFALAPGADTLPPERHLGYAITWYGLALVLLGVYFAYHVSVGRLGFAPSRPED